MNSINAIVSELEHLKEMISEFEIMVDKSNKKDREFLKQIKNATGDAIAISQLGYSYAEFRRERRLLKLDYEELVVQFKLLGGNDKLSEYKSYLDINNVPKKKRLYQRRATYFKNFSDEQRKRAYSHYHVVL